MFSLQFSVISFQFLLKADSEVLVINPLLFSVIGSY